MQSADKPLSAPQLRGELARADVHLYEVAPHVPVHPRTLGEMLNGHRPLTSAAAERILSAIRKAEMEKRSAAWRREEAKR